MMGKIAVTRADAKKLGITGPSGGTNGFIPRTLKRLVGEAKRQSQSDLRAALAPAVKRFGRLDILVNNAARGMKYVSDSFMTEPTRFWEISPETWRLIIDTNGSASDDKNRLGTDHQHLREPGDHAPPRIHALWSVEGRA